MEACKALNIVCTQTTKKSVQTDRVAVEVVNAILKSRLLVDRRGSRLVFRELLR